MGKRTKVKTTKYVVRGIIQDNSGKVLILQRPEGTWCLPGGKMNLGEEDPKESLSREIFEETGLMVVSSTLIATHEDEDEKVLWNNRYFVIENYSGDFKMNDQESISYAWIDLNEISGMEFAFSNGDIIADFLRNISR